MFAYHAGNTTKRLLSKRILPPSSSITPSSSSNAHSNNSNNVNGTSVRHVSLLHKMAITSTDDSYATMRRDLDRAIELVRKYDPSGYLPGLLVETRDAKIGYFAARAFWVETGLKFDMNQNASSSHDSISASRQVSGIGQKGIEISPSERVDRWKRGIDSLYDDITHNDDDGVDGRSSMKWDQSPTLRLLHYLLQKKRTEGKPLLSKVHFDQILHGRELDIERKQYPTVDSLKDHALMSCGSLLHLVLECADVDRSREDVIYNTANDIGIVHGLANALRTSVPVASSTGKIIIPQDLCDKYGVRSPRYLLSALGMGDKECKSHLQSAVRDIVSIAREHLEVARSRREEILETDGGMGERAISAFLPSLPSETFLDRLERHNYDLTDRSLRNIGTMEHILCGGRLVAASFKKTY